MTPLFVLGEQLLTADEKAKIWFCQVKTKAAPNAMPECGVRTLFLRKKKEVKRKIEMLKTFQRRANGVFIVCMPVCGEVIGTKPAWGRRWLNIVQKSALCRMHGNM